MSTWTWTYKTHSEAHAQYTLLKSQGCKVRMWLAYSGEGWKVSVCAW